MAKISELTIEHCKKHAAKQCSTCPFVGAYCTAPTTEYPSEKYDNWIEARNRNIETLYAT